MTSIPVTIVLEAPPVSPPRTRLRRQHARPTAPLDWAQFAAAELPVVELLARCRLDDGSLCGAEAAGPPLPGRMAGPMERDTMLLRIGRAACAWQRGPVAVAVTAADIADGRLAGQVATTVLAAGLAADRLELLLPEGALVGLDDDGVLALAALRDLGIGLILDGFGIGLTSLALLRHLPLTAIRLSRSLVRGLPGAADDVAIARAGIAVAHAMGLSVIADGIETEAQRAMLALYGCDEGQGPLMGRVGSYSTS